MREKRARSHDKSEPFFDFELTDADFDEPFTVDVADVPPQTLHDLTAQFQELEAVDQNQTSEYDPKRTDYSDPEPLAVVENDPLHPRLFVGHHRRMEREERRMQMLERQQLIMTASKVRQQREQLLKTEWKAYVEKIVKIHDTSDGYEMKRKRDMALSEIQQFLQKFDEYNARHNRRESKPEHAERKKLEAKQRRAKVAKEKNAKLQKAKALEAEIEQRDIPLSIELRPFAFGYMLPTRPFPPQEYSLPALLIEEVQAHEVAEKVSRNMPWLKR